MNENTATMPPEAILSQMLFGGLMQQSVSIAAKFGIADLVGEKAQTAEELAAATGTHAASLYRVLANAGERRHFFRKLLTENSS